MAAKMQSKLPARKVWVGALAGAIVTIVVWIVETAAKLTVPAGVTGSGITVVSFLVSYLIPPAHDDRIVTA